MAAGRPVGAATVARLHTREAFRQAMEAAGAERPQVRDAGLVPTADCAAEAGARAVVLQ